MFSGAKKMPASMLLVAAYSCQREAEVGSPKHWLPYVPEDVIITITEHSCVVIGYPDHGIVVKGGGY